MGYSEDSGRIICDNKVQSIILKCGLEDMLGQEVFTHGIEEFKTRDAAFSCAETVFMITVDIEVVEFIGNEKTTGRD